MPARLDKVTIPTKKRCFAFTAEQDAQLELARKRLGKRYNLELTMSDAVHLCIKQVNSPEIERVWNGKAEQNGND